MKINRYFLNAVLFAFSVSSFMPLLAQDSDDDVEEIVVKGKVL